MSYGVEGFGSEDELVILVRRNLVHCQLWTEVELSDSKMQWEDQTLKVLSGKPSLKVSQDDASLGNADQKEYILPVELSQYRDGFLTVECIDKVFNKLCPVGTKRIILAIVNDDGTIVFYYVYEGLRKPRKN